MRDELNSLRNDAKRYEWDADLREYAAGQTTLRALGQSILLLKAAVLAEQEEFVKKCFGRVNEVLLSLTVKDFEVVYEKNKSGTEPVYGIGLKYRGQRVDGQRVPFTLSDGDRRSLALAVFIATLDQDEAKEKCIVVLDDPVTSLDTHRQSETVKQVVRLSGEARQVIVLSHFKTFLAKLLKRLPGTGTVCIQCTRQGDTSRLSPMLKSAIQATEYDLLIEQMQSFVDGSMEGVSPRSMLQDVRIVVETEVRSRYRRHLAGFSGDTLGKMLDHLANGNVLAGPILAELRYLNGEVSEEHHEISEDYDPCDAQSVAERAMTLLFDTMVSLPTAGEPVAAN